MITPNSMGKDANKITDLYARVEQQIFNLIIDKLQDNTLGEIDSSNVLQWQQHQLNQLNSVVDEAVKIVAGNNTLIEAELKHLIKDNGQQIVSEIDNTLRKQTSKTVPVSQEVTDMIGSYLQETFSDFNTHINSTLLSRNVGDNAAGKAYQDIINKATAQTITGLKSHEQAINDAVYKWIESGLSSTLTNKAGSEIPIDSYARMVVNSSAHKIFNDLRLKRMEDYGTRLALMSSHAASREACAPIQGHVVNLVPESSPDYDKDYDSIYNHDYGKAGGTQGRNCSHMLFPYHKGWNTNNQPQYNPEESMRNGQIQQKQRGYERNVRKYKQLLQAAEKLQDTGGIQHYKNLIAGNQKRIRDLVKDHDFLYRDYRREKVISKAGPDRVGEVRNSINKHRRQLEALHAEFGRHGLPKTVDEYRQVLYNKRSNQGLHGYISARREGIIEPVYTYRDYQNKYRELSGRLVGIKTTNGTKITGISNHAVARALGALHDESHGGRKRIALSTGDIQKALSNGRVNITSRSIEYESNKVKVSVSFEGNIITLTPKRKKS
jgi:hypothetical protein